MTILRQTLVIARRDFTALVFTPTFLLFLLAPLIMFGFAGIGGMSAGQLAANAGARERIVAVVPVAETAAFERIDKALRPIAGGPAGPPQLIVLPATAGHDDAADRLRADPDTVAMLEGSAASPRIAERSAGGFPGRYLTAVAQGVDREGPAAAADVASPAPAIAPLGASGPGSAARSGLGYATVFVMFLLTLLLAGQTVGMLAEEKGNKVIEILAAAVPLEAVFFGKIIGMAGVALLFIGFWGALIAAGLMLLVQHMPGDAAALLALTPAVGWPVFALLCITYFLSAFLLLGVAFLGVGAQASTVREIQMLSLPITFFQVGMFSLAGAASNAAGSTIAHVAQLLPWSSPFAMAARAATDAALWPHVAALTWQLLWVALSTSIAVRAFRAGVLRSGGGWRLWRRRVPVQNGPSQN